MHGHSLSCSGLLPLCVLKPKVLQAHPGQLVPMKGRLGGDGHAAWGHTECVLGPSSAPELGAALPQTGAVSEKLTHTGRALGAHLDTHRSISPWGSDLDVLSLTFQPGFF